MDWIYDLPNWLFGALSILFFNLLGVAGLFATRNWVRRLHVVDHSHNAMVSYFLASVSVFYGITLGLLAVGAWTNYTSVEAKVDVEAQVIASLYRDFNAYPASSSDTLRSDLRAYTKDVVERVWPLQRKGIVDGDSRYLDRMQTDIVGFQPTTLAHQIIQAEVFKQFNVLIEARRGRMNSVTTHMPRSLWTLVILGALITIAVTLFFDTPSFKMHLWMKLSLATLLGLMIFLIGTLDSPFRGRGAVTPVPIQRVYEQWLQ